ncbi:hypothetical protein DD583_31835, partial [Klebsiella pneumoniae]
MVEELLRGDAGSAAEERLGDCPGEGHVSQKTKRGCPIRLPHHVPPHGRPRTAAAAMTTIAARAPARRPPWESDDDVASR